MIGVDELEVLRRVFGVQHKDVQAGLFREAENATTNLKLIVTKP